MRRIIIAAMMIVASVVGVITVGGSRAEARWDYQASVEDLVQVNAGTTFVDVAWKDDDPNTVSYEVIVESYNGGEVFMTKTANKYCRATGLTPGTSYAVTVKSYDQDNDTGYSDYSSIKTIPNAPSGFCTADKIDYKGNISGMGVSVDSAGEDDTEFSLYDSKGKLLATKHDKHYTNFSIRRSECFTIKARHRISVDGKTYYSDYAITTTIPQPKVKSFYYKKGKLTVTWNKVLGATGYDVFVSAERRYGFKKVKSVGNGSKKITITKLGRKRIKPSKRYYCYVVAKKKVGSVTYKSAKDRCWDSDYCLSWIL